MATCVCIKSCIIQIIGKFRIYFLLLFIGSIGFIGFYWILKHLKYTINLSYGILKVYVVNRFLAHINTCLEQVIGFYYY